MLDVREQLRGYGEQLDALITAMDMDEHSIRPDEVATLIDSPVRQLSIPVPADPRRRWPVAIAAAVAVLVVVGGVAWLFRVTGSDSPVADTVVPTTSIESTSTTVADATPTTVIEFTPTTVAAPPTTVVMEIPIAITAVTAQELRGYVAVASPDTWIGQDDSLQMFQPGGNLVSRANNVIPRGNLDYPILITAGRLLLGGRILDIDLAEPPISLWTNGSVIPGSGPGVVWLAGPRTGRGTDDYLWVSKIDVESLAVGEQVDITDLFSRPIVGVGDGLIVATSEEELAYWSPTDGLLPLDQLGELDSVVAASGDLVVVASPGRVRVLDITSGEYSDPIMLDFPSPVSTACLSPDRQHVIIVGSNGEAVVGDTQTGEVVRRLYYGYPTYIQPKHGIGWTTNDQLVFVGVPEGDAGHVFSYDIASGESYVFAQLDGSTDTWWLTASGTMC